MKYKNSRKQELGTGCTELIGYSKYDQKCMKVQEKHGKVTQNMHEASRNYRYVWDVSADNRLQTNWASGNMASYWSTLGRRGPGPHVRCPGNPNPIETEEADPRARPAFGLDADSLGGTRICSLLDRGTMSFRISWN